MKTFDKMPAVFSLSRSLLITDGAFYNLIGGKYEDHPLCIIRHGILGTQNVTEGEADNVANGERKVANVQQTETAKTAHNAQGLVVVFDLRMLNLADGLAACAANNVETTRAVRESLFNFVERAKNSDGLIEVANRYARNIANGSWLWSNRTIASTIEIEVVDVNNGAEIARFDALSIPMNHFKKYSTGELAVGAVLAAGLRGDRRAGIQVRATVRFGINGSVEVHPSQAFLENKPKGFARALYKLSGSNIQEQEDRTQGVRIMGHAGLRDQKITNCLRRIDTWYKDFDLIRKPIPIEPNGANLEFMEFFRHDKKSGCATSILSRLNELDPSTPDGMYIIGSLIRGGVYGEKDKAPVAKKKDGANDANGASDKE